jgi:hypothetical protein
MVSAAEKPRCHTCGRSFSGSWPLKRHIEQVCSDGSKTPSFDCSVCNQSYKRRGESGTDGLGRHLRSARHIAKAMLEKATRTGKTCTVVRQTENGRISNPLERMNKIRGLAVVVGVDTKATQSFDNTIAPTSGPGLDDDNSWAVEDQKHSLELAASHQLKCTLPKLDAGPHEVVQSSQELPEDATQHVLSETDTRDSALIALPIRPSRKSVSDQLQRVYLFTRCGTSSC